MRFTPWATRLVLTLSLSATAVLTACGGGGDDGDSNTQVRLLNATRSYAQLDLSANDKTVTSKVAYAAVGDYATVSTKELTLRVLTSDVGTSINASQPTLNAGSNYTYISYGFAGTVATRQLEDNQTAPEANKAKLSVLNFAPDAGALDIYLTTAANCALTTETALVTNLAGHAGSVYNLINSGNFRVCVTGYGRRSDLRLEIPSITLDSASVNSLILVSTDGGVLVNGMTLVQKGAVKNYPTTLSRVRVVSALAGTPTVAASINGTSVLPASLPPNTTDYYSFTAGAAVPTAVTVNGAAVGAATSNFVAGNDYTLLVWGTAGDPKVVPLSDDNRLPSVVNGVKIRLVNGLSVAGSLATLNVDYQSQATNTMAGTSSAVFNISPSTGAVVTVNSPLEVDAIYNPGTGTSSGLTPLTANGVYTVFVMGDPTPGAKLVKGKLSKDR